MHIICYWECRWKGAQVSQAREAMIPLQRAWPSNMIVSFVSFWDCSVPFSKILPYLIRTCVLDFCGGNAINIRCNRKGPFVTSLLYVFRRPRPTAIHWFMQVSPSPKGFPRSALPPNDCGPFCCWVARCVSPCSLYSSFFTVHCCSCGRIRRNCRLWSVIGRDLRARFFHIWPFVNPFMTLWVLRRN